MKSYPSIARDVVNKPIYAFDKLDGSNIRAEWTKKGGFSKFGTRRRLLGEDEPIFGKAIPLIMNNYSESLSKIFKDNRWQKAVAFFEFYGSNSFAGTHDENDNFQVKLIDVSIHKKGLLEPKVFLKTFKNVEHAELLYHGNPNKIFADSVRSGELDGMTFEGVVCKGEYTSPGMPLMFKIKNSAWIEKLKNLCGEDESKFKDLM